MSLSFFLLLCLPSLTLANSRSWRRSSSRNVPSAGYYDPNSSGGSMLTQVPDTFPAGQGEPINIILSGNSDAAVLVDLQSAGGLRNYYLSVGQSLGGFASECLGQHSGSDQGANLGDGNGYLNETAVLRWDYGDPSLGTCTETVEGGNHFRYWIQDGSSANSGAIFMAMSYEEPIAEQHDIIPNGYNLARDYFIGNVTQTTIPTANLTNSSSYSGTSSFGGYTYQTDIQYVSGMLPNTSMGINHNITVSTPISNACDGLVAVMTVKITSQPASTSAGWRPIPSRIIPCLSIVLMIAIPLFL